MPQEPVPAAYRIFIVEDDPTIAEIGGGAGDALWV